MNRTGPVDLSVVVPLYNEAESVGELARRCAAAARRTGRSFEIVLVDDASTDGTWAAIGEAGRDPAVGAALQPVALTSNRGQYGATVAGLAAARGAVVAVLDGDLQDPPEFIPELVGALDRDPACEVAFAIKASRQDAAWMRAGCAAFGAAQRWLARVPAIDGAGSYCAMRQSVAVRLAGRQVATANLAAVIAALAVRHTRLPYDKVARAHGTSRVGPIGLVREAIGSLAVTGALQRLAWWAAGAAAAAGSVGAGVAIAL